MTDEVEERTQHRIEVISLAASKPVWAVIGILLSLIGTSFGLWLSRVQNETDRMKAQFDSMVPQVVEVSTRLTALAETQKDIRYGVTDLNKKIDEFLKEELEFHASMSHKGGGK